MYDIYTCKELLSLSSYSVKYLIFWKDKTVSKFIKFYETMQMIIKVEVYTRYQYPVYPPFAVRISSSLLGIDRINRRHISLSMVFQIS